MARTAGIADASASDGGVADASASDVAAAHAGFAAHAHAHAAPLPASTSDLELPLEPFRAVPRPSAEAALALAPSAFLVNHSGAYHASTVYLRGFDTGEGQDLEVLADGMPLNEPSNAHGHGYADAHFLIPELVSAVRVTEGPFAPCVPRTSPR